MDLGASAGMVVMAKVPTRSRVLKPKVAILFNIVPQCAWGAAAAGVSKQDLVVHECNGPAC